MHLFNIQMKELGKRDDQENSFKKKKKKKKK